MLNKILRLKGRWRAALLVLLLSAVGMTNAQAQGSHDYVDLGLPSGLLWATCNVGASSPEEYGDYFAWGETSPKDTYNWSTYQYANGTSWEDPAVTKYCNNASYGYNGFTDTLTVLLPEDDAATANWGAEWRMATKEEWQELLDNTTNEWTTQNGVNGRLFTAANGGSLFLPAAGWRWDDDPNYAGSYDSYWSSSLHTDSPIGAWNFYGMGSFAYFMNGANRAYGFSVRPVRNASQVITTHWLPNSSDYEENMPVTAVVEIDGVEQQSTMLELGAFSGEECRGSQMPLYFEPTQRYIYQMTVFGEEGDEISFRLYDHATQQELDLAAPEAVAFNTVGYGNLPNPVVLNFRHSYDITATAQPEAGGTVEGAGAYLHGDTCILTATANEGYVFIHWTLGGEVVSNSPTYSFEVTAAGDYTAHFHLVQTLNFSQGWNWWSTYIECADADVLAQLEEGLGENGQIIKSQTATVSFVDGSWYGSLTAVENERSYRVKANADVEVSVAGLPTQASAHPITLNPGWTWIGYPWSQPQSVEAALEGFEPEANDFIKGRNAYTMYYAENGYNLWFGPLDNFEPGEGYVYYSNSDDDKTLTFNVEDGRVVRPNVTTDDNHYRPEAGHFADNMSVTAIVELDGVELRSDSHELAAFVGGECRGSVRLMYIEPLDRYVAFLTVFGNTDETLSFRLTDGMCTSLSFSELAFVSDGMAGTLTEPFKVRFDGMTGVSDDASATVKVYPNPTKGVFNVEGYGMRHVEVLNALGQVIVSEEAANGIMQVDLGNHANGLYVLRVVTDGGVKTSQIIKQ